MHPNVDTPQNTTDQLAQTNTDAAQGARRWLIRETVGILFVAALLFISAGRLNWGMGWALVGLYIIWVGANAILLMPRSPGLLAERAKRQRSAKTWDTVLLSIIGIATMVKLIIAGLDMRFAWTTSIPLWVQLSALLIAALGYALGTWAMVANAFFAMVNRIQADRGHVVVSDGPYRYVRHPGYIGSIAFELMTPLLLGSLWALIPGVLAAILTVIRTSLEDQMLHEALAGYPDYAKQVRYRLVPGIW